MCSIHQQKLHSVKLFKNYNQDKKILNITSIRLKYYTKISLPCVYPVPLPPPPPGSKWTNISDSENYGDFENPALPKFF